MNLQLIKKIDYDDLKDIRIEAKTYNIRAENVVTSLCDIIKELVEYNDRLQAQTVLLADETKRQELAIDYQNIYIKGLEEERDELKRQLKHQLKLHEDIPTAFG